MMVMGELTEKLQTVIEEQIIPGLLKTKLLATDGPMVSNQPLCTFVFDREAYQPAFFKRLWEKYKIAIITYLKNVKDKWCYESFESIDVKVCSKLLTCNSAIVAHNWSATGSAKSGACPGMATKQPLLPLTLP